MWLQVDLELDLDDRRLLTPSTIFGMCVPFAFLVPEGCSEDIVWDSDVVLKTPTWTT